MKFSSPSAETIDLYVAAEFVMKKLALVRLHEPEAKLRRDRSPDPMIDFLRTLKLCGVRNRRLLLHASSDLRKPTMAPHNRSIYRPYVELYIRPNTRRQSSTRFCSENSARRKESTSPLRSFLKTTRPRLNGMPMKSSELAPRPSISFDCGVMHRYAAAISNSMPFAASLAPRLAPRALIAVSSSPSFAGSQK